MTVSLHNRRKLEEAIACLLNGTVKPADGKLTWKNVAAVAEVSKATADRAGDLRDEFRRQLARHLPAHTDNPAPASRSHSDIDLELTRLRQQNAELKETSNVLHSVILALIKENQRLSPRLRRDDADVVALTTS
jgi:hypothetical protein